MQGSNNFSISEYKNTIVRERYNQLLRYYSKKDEKTHVNSFVNSKHVNPGQYSDNNFPLTLGSIFYSKQTSVSKIKWVRISELFRNRKLILKKNEEESKIILNKSTNSFSNANFLNTLNLIKNSRSLLNKIFENATYNESGIYMLKLFQSHEWKCVIIDDFIPVIEDGSKTEPLFTQIKSIQSQ